MKKIQLKKFFGLFLVLCLVLTSVNPVQNARAEETAENGGYRFEKVDNSVIETALKKGAIVEAADENQLAADDMVRVSIILEGDSVIDAGFSTENIAENEEALEMIETVLEEQKAVEENIAEAIGEDAIDVQWNLAVAANIISADVAFGNIEAIAEVEGVKDVIIETKYLPCAPETAAEPNMAVSQNVMTGVAEAWAQGYTGAGGRIAIIDTGLDVKHQSFNNDAFLYALAEDAEAAGVDVDTFIADLDLLDAEDIDAVLPLLNSYATLRGNVTAEKFVLSDKIAYAFNYVDKNFYVEHVRDTQGEHGSHVSGIATANRYLKTEDGFADALDTVFVAGNAPDAQIIVMKVFGAGGGAYDSDYMAAIEDAILLGCDSVNLSLGSAAAGWTTSGDYQEIMDKLTASETVVVMSAGNSGSWADKTYPGAVFYDDINFNTVGSPGSFTNSLAVASVDNHGSISRGIYVGDAKFGYSESAEYGNKELATLCGENESVELEYVFTDGLGQAADFEGMDLTGKVVFCQRGSISFFEKANNAVARGAVATIIYNNQPGVIGLNLTGYSYTAPCVSILQQDANVIRSLSEAQTTDAGLTYYTGKIVIDTKQQAIPSSSGYFNMSSFSSLGVPGNLSLKPEISAPGGSIYSVNGSNDKGGGSDQYELMSGTSMAAPQITGMMAVLTRFVETAEKTFPEITKRAIAQSLLMSTAVPMRDANGDYYSVMKQGAGLANINAAINAATVVMMDEASTVSAADGKVKAELGDDPARTGEYSLGFTLTNVTDAPASYTLGNTVFTQNIDSIFLSESTLELDADTTFYADGKNLSDVVVVTNPYAAEYEAARAELLEANAALEAAQAALEAAQAALTDAKDELTAAKAEYVNANVELNLAKVQLALATVRRFFSKNGEKAYQEALARVAEAEKNAAAATKRYNDAKTAEKNANTAVKDAKKALDAAARVQKQAAKNAEDAEKLYASWVQPEVTPNTVTVQPGESVKIDVEFALTDNTKAVLDYYYENGAYIEAYVTAASNDSTSSHSIPVIGFYGNWTEASMFDRGSYEAYASGAETLPNYFYDGVNNSSLFSNAFFLSDASGKYYFGGNLYAEDETYDSSRNALSLVNGDVFSGVKYTLMRNAAKRAFIIVDNATGEVIVKNDLAAQYAAYYSTSQGKWMSQTTTVNFNWNGKDSEGKVVPEGTSLTASIVAVPEYNLTADGEIDWASLESGAFFSTSFTIDNTAPEVTAITGTDLGETPEESETDKIYVTAKDNRNIAAIAVFDSEYNLLTEEPISVEGASEVNNLLVAEDLTADVYYIQVFDYAGNAATYRVFLKIPMLDTVESFDIVGYEMGETVKVLKNNSVALKAVLEPFNLTDSSIVWTTTDPEIASVDANGIVTGNNVGTCKIVAAPTLDFFKFDYVTVEVIELDLSVNGVVWDEVGNVWFSEINSKSLPEYNKFVEWNAPVNNLAWVGNELYATDIDTSNGISNLYKVNNDLSLDQVGTSSICYMDMAEAPHLTGLIGTYFNYVVLIDPATGDYAGAFDYSDSDLVGITYIGSQYHSTYRAYLDMYYLLDADGNMYLEAFIKYRGSYYYFNGADDGFIGSTGIETDMPYFQSIYYNGEYTFISNFIEADNVVTLYAMSEETGEIFRLGQFADGVWPVAALSEVGVTVVENAAGEAFADAEIKGEAVAERVEKRAVAPIAK